MKRSSQLQVFVSIDFRGGSRPIEKSSAHHPGSASFLSRSAGQKGFTLIVTLMLMVLIAIIAVGLLSLSTISLRSSGHETARATARANARLALMIAIGEIQKYAGPDQRVTANAELVYPYEVNKKWTGVWTTTALGDETKPMVGGNTDLAASSGLSAPSEHYFTDRRNLDPSLCDADSNPLNDPWKTNLRLTWLVSGNPAAASSPAGVTGAQITLVEKAAGLSDSTAADPKGDRVTAPLVSIINGNQNGGYAYWVGDESQKARIDIGTPHEIGNAPKQPDPLNMADGGYYNLMGSFGPNFTDVKADNDTPYLSLLNMSSTDRTKIVSGPTVALATNTAPAVTKRNFHDITTDSLGVLCDVREGGLKKDLTAYLETTGDVNSDTTVLPNRSVGDAPVNPGLAAKEPILIGPNYKNFGPNFAHMRNWAALRSKVESSGATRKIDPQYPPATTMTGTSQLPQDQVVDMARAGQAIHPVMTSYMMLMDLSRDTGRAGGRALRTHFYPRITLWNPYNVTLKGARYLIAGRGFPRWSSMRMGGVAPSVIAGDSNGWCAPGFDIIGYFYFVTDPVDFAPGECLVFTPDVTKSSGAKLASNSVKYNPTDISKNVLSATQAPGPGATNFYFDAGWQVAASVNLNNTIPYGCYGSYVSWSTMSVCCLKKTAGSNASIAPSSVFNNANNETLQWVNTSANGGSGQSYFAHASGRNDFPGLRPYEANEDRVPIAGWAQEERFAYFSDQANGRFRIPHNAFTHYNVRASMTHRSPYCQTAPYYEINVGNYKDWYYPNINLQNTTMIPSYLPGYDGIFKLRGSPFSYPGTGSDTLSYPIFEVPHAGYPLLSLANLQSVQFGYQSWQPTFVLGHSLCDVRTSRDASVYVPYFAPSERWKKAGTFGNLSGIWYEMLQMDLDPAKKAELNQYDTAFMVNQNLWDRYYLSGIPYTASGNVNWDPNSEYPLPNSRLTLNSYRTGTNSHLQDKIGTSASTSPFDYSAYYLMNKGAFNINSTSQEAWKAFFSTLNTIKRPSGPGGGSSVAAVFSRMLMPPSDKAPLQILGDNGAWNGMKPLTAAEIDLLSLRMVEIVKARGPFLGLADFVNRRLRMASGPWSADEPSLMGPLQSAIELASMTTGMLNYNLADASLADGTTNPTPTPITCVDPPTFAPFPDPNSYYPKKQYGAGALLNQADFLQTLAPSMTARGDTFVVRAYGEAKDASGKVIAQAWCEAIVQRTPDYMASKDISQPSDANGNNPMEPMTVRSLTGNTWSANSGAGGILPVNKLYGRKMAMVKFRWLHSKEI